MMTPGIQSGWAIERTGSPHGKLEILACCPAPRCGLTHFSLSPDLPFTPPEFWTKAESIRYSAFTGPFCGVSAIVSRVGDLEMIAAQTDGVLAHFSYHGVFGWSGPTFLPGKAAGPPAFIQSRFGGVGNFEVIVPRPGGGLSHFWRDNDGAEVWHEATQPTATGVWSGLGLIQSNFGNLEIVGVREGSLAFLWQNGPGGAWSIPVTLTNDADFAGRPALIQSTYGTRGNFEVVAAKRSGQLIHYWRNNGVDGFPWLAGTAFAPGATQPTYAFDDVSLFQSSYGRLEVFAREKFREKLSAFWLIHYRAALGQRWEGPIKGLSIPYDRTWWP
jgi:hypothetical protein